MSKSKKPTGKQPNKSITSSIIRISTGIPIVLLIILILLLIVGWIKHPIPLPPHIVDRGVPWESGDIAYSGKGRLIAYMGDEAVLPGGTSVEIREPIYSMILGQDRPLIIYLPPGYNEKNKEYPLLIAFHGNGGRAQSWIRLLIEPMESAFENGTMPPTVIVSVDFSISGDGTDDPKTPYDDRRGSRYVNSNLGRFEDHFAREIIPFVFSNFNISTNPDSIAMIGNSMGGFGVLHYALKYPRLSNSFVLIYPSADTRYSIGGDRMADYDPKKYEPITTDDPKRIVNDSIFGGLFGITEEWMYYAVFDSDKLPGNFWKEDIPVWKRLMMVNPVETLDHQPPDLSAQSYYIITGSKDDFNSDAYMPILLPRLIEAGAKVYPSENIIEGGRHDQKFVVENIDNIILWLGTEINN